MSHCVHSATRMLDMFSEHCSRSPSLLHSFSMVFQSFLSQFLQWRIFTLSSQRSHLNVDLRTRDHRDDIRISNALCNANFELANIEFCSSSPKLLLEYRLVVLFIPSACLNYRMCKPATSEVLRSSRLNVTRVYWARLVYLVWRVGIIE